MTHLVINGTECWYDAAGHITHKKWPDGNELFYDTAGNVTRTKWPDGTDDLHTN